MIRVFGLAACASVLLAGQIDWIAAGNRALDQGNPREAAADYAQAIEVFTQAGCSPDNLIHLRVTLATAYQEAGQYREMEVALRAAQKNVGESTGDLARAELLNSWSTLHLRIGKLDMAEAELREAWRVTERLRSSDDLRATVLNNLAAVEIRSGRPSEALGHQREALRIWESLLPSDHRRLIRGWTSMASLQFMMGQTEDARLAMERAIASAEKTYGPGHPLLADLWDNDAFILDKLKIKKSAKLARERARAIRGGQTPPSNDRLTWDVRAYRGSDSASPK